MLRFMTARNGSAPGPEAIRRLLARLGREQIDGQLELVASGDAPASPEAERTTLAAAWDAALETLPADWSDVYAEVELVSSDWIERAALLTAPLNPRRDGGKPAFRFRVARVFGYGASPQMVRRCLERCDAEGIRGSVRILRALSDTRPVATQGPVWHMAGQTI